MYDGVTHRVTYSGEMTMYVCVAIVWCMSELRCHEKNHRDKHRFRAPGLTNCGAVQQVNSGLHKFQRAVKYVHCL